MTVADHANPSDLDGLDRLDREELARLTAGIDFWHTAPAPSLGLEPLQLTDGPSGARGASWGAATSTCVPCGSALAATWDPELVERIGVLLGQAARAKGAGVLLAPTVNLHRHPLGGRNFECFSEDPFLTGELAAPYVTGVQSVGVGCAVKHFVANDQEQGRMTVDVDVDDRTLRELYLVPFERVVEAGVWAVMAAYNRLDGRYCSENERLLRGILKDEWGFDGVVVSDWFGTRSPAALAAGLDLEMPGPGLHLGEALLGGDVDRDQLLDAAARVVRLYRRTTAGVASTPVDPGPLVTEAAAAATVLLANDGTLPLAGVRKVALVGPYADRITAQGGGSAEVTVRPMGSLLAELRDRGMDVVHEPGIQLSGAIRVLDPRRHATADGPGMVDVDYFPPGTTSGTPIASGSFRQTRVAWTGPPHPDLANGFVAVVRTTFTPDRSGPWRFGLTSIGRARVLLDDEVLVDLAEPVPGSSWFGLGSDEVVRTVELEAGVERRLRIEYHHDDTGMPLGAVQLGAEAVLPDDALDRAVAAAAEAEVAIVVVGSDSRWETEGFDRADLRLPGDQDELIRRVAAANPRTVVVVNCGSPVLMDWADEVAALLQLWYPGEAGPEALATVLLGETEPGGRLPTTFAHRREDAPSDPHYPGEGVEADGLVVGTPEEGGVVRYSEGLLMGYRGFDRAGIAPRFCFGHGLGYTTFEYGDVRADAVGDDLEVSVDVTNTGGRDGSEVVQVYVRQTFDAALPFQELKGFAKRTIAAGATETVRLRLGSRAFAHWDPDGGGWVVQPGSYDVAVGASSRDIRGVVTVAR